MSATNPQRVKDLIHRFGWDFIPRLAALGVNFQAEAQILFVDSGATNALDADDTVHGMSFEKPLATIDYAIGLCTANEGSVILVAPGHNESLAAATIDFDVAGVTCIGLGEGTLKPRIDFDNAASSVDIGANNVHLVNLTFMPSITDILVGVDVEAAVTGAIIEKCDFAEGEGADDEFVIGVDIKAGCTDTKITNCLFRTMVAAAGCTHGVKLTGASDNVIIEKSRFIGNWSTAAIGGDTTLSTDVLIDDVTIKTKDNEAGIKMLTGTTGIIRNVCIEATSEAVDTMIVADAMAWFNNYGVTADGSAAELIGGGEVSAAIEAYNLDHLAKTADGGTNYPTQLTTNSILAMLMSDDGIASGYNKTTDSLEAISDKITAGTDTLGGINLDHLALTTTGVDGDGDLSSFVVDKTILAHIMAVDADTSDYDASKHSLEAIGEDADAILEDTITLSGGTLPASPTAGSLARYIASGGTALGQPLPGSMSLVDLIGNYTGSHDETEADDNIKAHLDLIKTDAETVITAVGTTLPATLAENLQIFMGYNMRSIPGSAMPVAVWFVDSNISESGDGTTPATAFKTLTEAITACSNSVDDWVFVFDYSGEETSTITINKSFVHIIGNACKGMPYPRIKPTGAYAGITFTSDADRVEIANMTIGGGDQTVAAISFEGCAAGAYGNYIHDCVIGRDADAPCLYGIYVPSGAGAPYLVIENNRFIGANGAGIAATGSAIRIAGNATRCVIEGNRILDVGRTATPAIWLDGGVTEPTIIGNHIKHDTDTGTGGAITLGASVDDGWICGNFACDGKDDSAQNPFLDGASTNGWAGNYNGATITQPA